jgi:hypothetical protein
MIYEISLSTITKKLKQNGGHVSIPYIFDSHHTIHKLIDAINNSIRENGSSLMESMQEIESDDDIFGTKQMEHCPKKCKPPNGKCIACKLKLNKNSAECRYCGRYYFD